MKYHFVTIICSSLFITACDQHSTLHEQPQLEDKTIEQNKANISGFQDDKEPENGMYEEQENEFSDIKNDIASIDLVDLVNQVNENPAAIELLDFRTQGRIVSITTDTDTSGQRVAIVKLEHPKFSLYKSGNGLQGAFYCIFSLQDAAQFKPKQAIDFLGKILDIGERTAYMGQYALKFKEIYANCSSPNQLDDSPSSLIKNQSLHQE